MAPGELTLKHKGQLKNVTYFQLLILLLVLPLVNLSAEKQTNSRIFFA